MIKFPFLHVFLHMDYIQWFETFFTILFQFRIQHGMGKYGPFLSEIKYCKTFMIYIQHAESASSKVNRGTLSGFLFFE